jgi:exodeoxyribonuclease VII small subunit
MATKTEDYQELSLELDEVLAKLQQPNVQVDDAVKLYEQGLALIEQLEKQLATAENTIEKLKLAAVQAAKE